MKPTSRKPHLFILASAVVILKVLPVQAAEPISPLTLETAITVAREKNPALRKTRALEREAAWKPLEALSVNIPRFSITGAHLFAAKFQVLDTNFGGTTAEFPLTAPQSIFTFGAAWTVFDGFQGWNSYQAARKVHEATELELSRTAFTLDEEVQLRFYQALAAQTLAQVAEQNVKTLQDHLKKTQDVLNRGSATKFDLLRVQVQLEEAVSEKANADDNVILARRGLSVAMGLLEDERPVSGALPTPDESRIPLGIKPDFSAREDLEALQRRASAADQLHTAAQGVWIPRITLTAEQQYYNNQNFTLIGHPYRDAYALGIQLAWNIFDGGASLSRFRQSEFQAEQVDASAAQVALRAPQEFETWRRRYLYNSALFRAKNRAIETAHESVRLAQLGYGAGTRTSTDVLDAELDLFRARAGAVRSQVDGVEALINLELALGRKLQ